MEPGVLGAIHHASHPDMILRPEEPAPAANASLEVRTEWSERYVAWFIAQTPDDAPLPADVSPTHRYEVELAYCKQDPQRYERETLAEIQDARAANVLN